MIEGHYHETAAAHMDALDRVQGLRAAVESHTRSELALSQHLTYFHQLGFMDDRFFVDKKNNDIIFHWYERVDLA